MNKPYFEPQTQNLFIGHYEDSYSFQSHFHSFVEITYCFCGIQPVKIGESLINLTAGEAVVFFPNVVHEYICCTDSYAANTESISIMCNLNVLSETFPEFTTSLPANPHIKSEFISENVPLACRKIIKASCTAEQIGWTYIILSELLKNFEYKKSVKYTEFSLPSVITSYINENFAEPLSINYIAKKFGYSPSYIVHLFSDQLKIPFKTYLNSVRCDFAQSQIKTTKKSITEIAHLSGYNSLNTFCRCFKNHTGKTPSEFKKL